MPQMPAAARAGHLHAPHSKAHIFMLRHRLRFRRQQKAWPPASRIELRPTQKQQRPAPRAVIIPALVVLRQRPAERPLRPFLAQHPVLLRRQPRPPLRLRAHRLLGLLAHRNLLYFTQIGCWGGYSLFSTPCFHPSTTSSISTSTSFGSRETSTVVRA